MATDVGNFPQRTTSPSQWMVDYARLLSGKTGADPRLWRTPWNTDFAMSTNDYAAGSGGTATDSAGTGAPGSRVIRLSVGSTGGSFYNIVSPPASPSATIVTDWKLKRWGVAVRVKLSTAVHANTRIMFGLATVGGNVNLAVGSVGPISTSFLTSIAGGNVTTFPAGTALSTKAADVNNFVIIYLYNDLTTVWGNVDGESSDFVICATSTLSSAGAYFKAGHFPPAGAVDESYEIDNAMVLTET